MSFLKELEEEEHSSEQQIIGIIANPDHGVFQELSEGPGSPWVRERLRETGDGAGGGSGGRPRSRPGVWILFLQVPVSLQSST